MQTGAQRQTEFGTWQIAGLTPPVIYSRAALHDLSVDVFEAFQAFSPGGYEIGGVLFGTADQDEIRITATRPIPCEHRFGPEFILSSQDETIMQQLLLTYRRDAALAELAPVGWYRSRSKGVIEISDPDILIWNRFFPQPWQVVLVLCPSMDEPVKAGFFVRPPLGTELARRALQVFDASLTAPVPVDPAEPGGVSYAEPPAELMSPPRAQTGLLRSYSTLAGASVLFAAGLGAVLFYGQQAEPPAPPPPSVALRVVQKAGQLHVAWDSSALPIQQARQARLDVEDGARNVSLPLDPAILRLGYWLVPRTSSDVVVRLQVDSPVTPTPLVEVARFVGRPESEVPESAAPDDGLLTLREESAKLQNDLQVMVGRNRRMENVLVAARRAAEGQQAAAAAPAPPVAVPERPVTQVAATPVQAPPPAPTQTVPSTSVPQTLPAPEPVSRPPAYSGPRAGKLIWTGVLPPGGTLTIDGRRASSGTFSGALPGVNVRVAAYPAELSANGLSVYSGAARHARGDVTEPRSAQNGWMNTTYRYEPARAQDVSVAEAPATGNSFRKIVLRGGSRAISAVVISWEVVE